MVEKIQFDGRTAARPIRKDPKIKPFLADSDDARTGTVVLKDGTPERVVEKVVGEAAETREKEATKYGQVPLTDQERKQIDFEETSVPAARSAKGIARGKGVDDFLAYFDETLSVDEHREVFDRAKEQGAGGAGNRGRGTGTNAQRLAQANKRRKAEQGDRIKKFALLKQDSDAQEEIQRMGSIRDVFDIGFSRREGRLRGSGKDFERLEEVHEQRSERAQRVDERRSAKATRDPVQWANNPGKYDFPGIDTVQPQEIHEQRSERAQEADEREIAPAADTKQQWAQQPDQYDWPGVDRPETFGPAGITPLPESERNRQEVSSRPDVSETMPGELPAFDREERPDGPRPSFSRLSQDGVESLAADEEAESALAKAEESRAESGSLLETEDSSQAGFGGDVVDENNQSSFAIDEDVRKSQGQESRRDVEQASKFGIDDRSTDKSNNDSGDQSGLEIFGGGTRENETLF